MPSQPLKNGSPELKNNGKSHIAESTLKSILLLQRRAFLQVVHADERLVRQLNELDENIKSGEISDWNEAMQNYVKITTKNAQDKRIAYLQIVRDVEKRYAIKRQKKRR